MTRTLRLLRRLAWWRNRTTVTLHPGATFTDWGTGEHFVVTAVDGDTITATRATSTVPWHRSHGEPPRAFP